MTELRLRTALPPLCQHIDGRLQGSRGLELVRHRDLPPAFGDSVPVTVHIARRPAHLGILYGADISWSLPGIS